tara:strand:- start:2195 stop:2740 length:546 start_codon:yes stop_codon:yes gene_type:complete
MINIDADGLLVDWKGYVIENHFPYMTIEELNAMDADKRQKLLRQMYADDPQLFYKLEPLEGAAEFMQRIISLGEPWRILTSAGTDHPDFDVAAESKIQNLKKHFGISREHITVTESSSAKADYVENRGDILIDDFLRNVLQWVENRGVGVHFTAAKGYEAALAEVCESLDCSIPEAMAITL